MINKIYATFWMLYVTYFWVTTEGTPWEYVAPVMYAVIFFVLDVKNDIMERLR